jgi:FSR family fosmidomycin resistance protein-like MFS transporter
MKTQCNKEKFSPPPSSTQNTVLSILFSVSFCHFLNDIIQSLIPAIYPLLKTSFHLSFTQIGLITLSLQLTASLLQPFVGLYTDHRPKPYSLAIGMGLSLVGLIMFSLPTNFPMILVSAAMVGMGSSIFHPEASRITRIASGGRHGLAQSIFQAGGNAGTSFGPVLAYLIVIPHGQSSIGWFIILALLAIIILINVGNWYRQHVFRTKARSSGISPGNRLKLSPTQVIFSLAILVVLIFSKYFYLASMTSYYIT